jgi:hypothetical protein
MMGHPDFRGTHAGVILLPIRTQDLPSWAKLCRPSGLDFNRRQAIAGPARKSLEGMGYLNSTGKHKVPRPRKFIRFANELLRSG